ncbi:hypothetical protein C0Q70_15691 [Pomacea canaliculata]|uniref:PDZ domain-containing protein n=1 Tax=Pomacea canaliculata TaxID=400727 RepID=A0A2T7NVK0_POMCA|nr:hypothetical protein C0Q70_15691 [Pomacea canaliculata]
MKTTKGGEAVLKNLAEQLLTSDECWTFKQALQHFRRTRSVPTLCAQVRPLISTTERLMLLVELSHHLPTEPLRRDFHRLCTLQFPKYHTFLRYFTPHSPAGGGSKVVAQDPKGHLQVVRTRYEDGLIVTETDVTGPAGRSTRTEARSVEPHEVQRHENGFLTTGHKSNYSSRARSVSPYAVSSAGSASSTLHKSHLSSDAKSLARPNHHVTNQEDLDGGSQQKRVLLSRRSDGSLGVGIKGGIEYGTPIVIHVVEDGSQAQQQGLSVGDKIVDVNGKDFRNVTHAEAVSAMRNAWNVIMIVEPAGPNTDVTNDSRVDNENLARRTEDSGGAEMEMIRCCDDVSRDMMTGELLLVGVESQSSASKAGLSKGDIILQIDGVDVTSLTEKQIATLTNAKHVRLTIKRTHASATERRADEGRVVDDDVFSPLDFSSPNKNDLFFAASSPRFSGRSRSVDRLLSSRSPTRPAGPDAWSKAESSWDIHGYAESHSDDDFQQRVNRPRPYATSSAATVVHSARYEEEGLWSTGTRGRAATRQTPSEGPRYTLVYTPQGLADETTTHTATTRQQASAAVATTTQSRGNKTRYISNRSRSQESSSHASVADNDLQMAVQSGVEKRQRALRLSMHQVPDDHEDWKI